MNHEIVIARSNHQVTHLAAEDIRDMAHDSIRARGNYRLGLSGGKTLIGVFKRLARDRNTLPWSKIEIYWVDDRYVHAGDSASNYGSTQTHLLKATHPADVYPMVSGTGDPSDEAERYHLCLDTLARQYETDILVLDFLLLGLGEDGHVASLFPGSPALRIEDRWAVATKAPAGVPHRISMTVPVLRAARKRLFLITGPQKGRLLRRIFMGDASLPATLATSPKKPTTWLLDVKAARALGVN